MFDKHHIQPVSDRISFNMNELLKVVLECYAPPLASHLLLLHGTKILIDISISSEHYETLKKEMSNPNCTGDLLLSLLYNLNLSKFAAEVVHELQMPQ